MSNNENQIEENVNEKNKDEHFLPKGYVVKVTAKNKKFIEGPPEQLKKQRKSVKIFDKQQLSSLHSNGRHLLLNEKHFERLKHLKLKEPNHPENDFFVEEKQNLSTITNINHHEANALVNPLKDTHYPETEALVNNPIHNSQNKTKTEIKVNTELNENAQRKNDAIVTGLKNVLLPQDLVSEFLSKAQVNSDKNIETLGVLAGKNKGDELLVSHLVIPQQSGQSDSCTMEGNELVSETFIR